MSGAKIIEGLKEAVDGGFSRVHIDGQTWVRQEWQPIETAPKDGTDIILGALEQTYEGRPVAPRVTVGRWTTDEECREQIGDCGGECRCPEYKYYDPSWISWDGGFTEENPPTHWMPLPSPPREGGR